MMTLSYASLVWYKKGYDKKAPKIPLPQKIKQKKTKTMHYFAPEAYTHSIN